MANRVKESVEDCGGSNDSLQISSSRVQLPQWLFLYLIAQLVGGIWWAATLQSDVHHEVADRAREEEKLWQTIETQTLQIQRLERDLVELRSDVRNKSSISVCKSDGKEN